ncbi:hypothetical protein BMS3Abin16_00872 [archaeon BMS3Abin16]|nr:hypothetical protein BMS3Abin16_00872 [archaeon BMS3Abin16]
MAGRRKTIKHCVECGEKITGIKDYCAPCHAKILEKIKEVKRKKYKTDSGWGKAD